MFAETIKDPSILENSFTIMINKISDKDDDRESIIKKLNLIQEKGSLSEKSKILLGYGLKNLHLYHKPDLGRMKGNTTLLPQIT